MYRYFYIEMVSKAIAKFRGESVSRFDAKRFGPVNQIPNRWLGWSSRPSPFSPSHISHHVLIGYISPKGLWGNTRPQNSSVAECAQIKSAVFGPTHTHTHSLGVRLAAAARAQPRLKPAKDAMHFNSPIRSLWYRTPVAQTIHGYWLRIHRWASVI